MPTYISLPQAVVQFPKALPCLLEKMGILLAMQDWEQAYDVSKRVLTTDQFCIQAQAVTILFMLCREGKYSEVSSSNCNSILGMKTHPTPSVN